MIFDKSRVYTALNADELKVGSIVYLASNLAGLKELVINEPKSLIRKIKTIRSANEEYRFCDEGNCICSLAYLISEPEEKKLKCTDLKIGDVIRKGKFSFQINGICKDGLANTSLLIGGRWIDNEELADWEKVEE